MPYVNEQPVGLVRNALRSASSSAKRTIKSTISKEISSGIFKGKYLNSNEVIAALNAGKLTSRELKFIFKTIFLNTTDPKLLEDYSRIFLNNQSVVKNLDGLSERAFENTLKSKGFGDDQIRAMKKVWKDEGYSFGRTTSSKSYKSEFERYLRNSLPNDPIRKAISNLVRIKFPFRDFTWREYARLAMWLTTGQKILPLELFNIGYKVAKGNGLIGLLSGLRGMGGAILGTWARSYLFLWLFTGTVSVIIQMVKNISSSGVEVDNLEDFITVYGGAILKARPEIKYIIPWNISIKILTTIWNITGGLIRGDEETLKNQIVDTYKDVTGIEDVNESVFRAKDKYNSLFDEFKSSPEILTHLRVDSNRDVYWDRPEYPVRYYNGEWVVLIPGDGWYLLKDIE